MSKRGNARHRQERREQEGERRLDAMQVKALDTVSEIVERKVGKDESRQPRFTTPTSIFSSVFRWTIAGLLSEPGGYATTRQWDAWYREFAKREPFLVGVLNAATQIDRNRGWTLTGGQRQVKKYTDVLHALDDGQGWRTHIDWQAQSYYTTRMGFVAEVGREGRGGPLATLWSVDPARCEMSGNPETPLRYYPRLGGMQEWQADYFIRGKSLVSTDEAQLDYGYPAVARCYDLAKIMLGVYSHYQQKLNTKTPDGILTGKFIGEEQWDEAVRARAESLMADPSGYLNSIATIMSSGGDMPEFALTLLSSMPDRWDIDTWTKLLMRGYELAFGYQSEFYPESAGVLGRGNEVQIQHRNATAQGGKDFSLTYQERLQSVLPPTLEFQFEERDVAGETEEASLQLAKAQVITEMTKWAVNGQSVLTVPKIMTLAAAQGVVPDDWTPQDEDVTATDEEDAAVPALSERVRRAMRAFPSEPIVRHSWPSGKTRVLRAATRRSFHFPKAYRINTKHVPAGSSAGGQFASGEGGGLSNGDDKAKGAKKTKASVSSSAKVEPVKSKSIKSKMKKFSLFDPDLTDETITIIDGNEIVAFVQGEKKFGVYTALEIESLSKGGAKKLIEYLQENESKIIAKNSGKDTWGLWERFGFKPIKKGEYYADFVWEDNGRMIDFPKGIRRTVGQIVTKYRDELTNLVYNAWNKIEAGIAPATMQTALRTEHKRLIKASGEPAYFEGMREGGIASPADEATDEDYGRIKDWLTAQAGYTNDFAIAVIDAAGDETKRTAILSRVTMWADSVSNLGQAGLLSAKSDRLVIWHLGPTETHCAECVALDGKRHRVSWFLKRGYLPHTPPNAMLGCDGWGKCFITDAVTDERIGV